MAAMSNPRGVEGAFRLWIGGGAALAGRHPDFLLVDDRGRWPVDRGPTLDQLVDQLRHLNRTGLGDPYQFARPNERLPLAAVRYWQDWVAAQGPMVDGRARLRMEPGGVLVADIQPASGEPLTIPVEPGPVVVATGFPPERIIGVPAGLTVRSVFAAAAVELGAADLDTLDWYDPASAGPALRILTAAGRPMTGQIGAALKAMATWQHLRDQLPGRVLTGDEANTVHARPEAAAHWVVAGTGAAGLSGVSKLLDDPSGSARFTVVGREPAKATLDNPLWSKLRASDRVRMELGQAVTGVSLDDDGFSVAGVRGDGLIVSLGGRTGPPPAISTVVDRAAKDGTLRASFLFDDGGQYLCYRLRIGPYDIDVTGAASRFPPMDPVFTGHAGGRYGRPERSLDRPWLYETTDHRFVQVIRPDPAEWGTPPCAATRDAPPESGSFSGGYAPTAVQATRYRIAVLDRR
jgi:hypothetical protein